MISCLDIPHGHVERNSYVELCQAGNVEIVEVSRSLYLKDDDNICVQFIKLDDKNDKDIYPILKGIAARLLSRAIKSSNRKGDSTNIVKRQCLSDDVGFSTNVASSRVQSKLGISKPTLLQGTMDPFFLNLFKKSQETA